MSIICKRIYKNFKYQALMICKNVIGLCNFIIFCICKNLSLSDIMTINSCFKIRFQVVKLKDSRSFKI